MWSSALDAVFTALRYLAPATLLTIFWGQSSFLFRILKHIDLAVRSIVFSSDQQKESVLKWLEHTGPVRVERLDTVWRHGWILCSVLDTAMPGACAGHPPVRISLKHAQTIADHYLGVEPVFSREELETSEDLSRHQEWKLAHYLDRIREALAKIPAPVSKPSSQRTSPDGTQITLDYVAKGGGLTAAQVNNKMYFKIYPTTQQSLEPGDVTVLIKGPKDTYGMIVIPPVLGKAQLIRQQMLNLNKQPQYTENTLPITQGATYLRSFGKNDLKKAYYIPKTKYDIEIEVDRRSDHLKIGYVVMLEGKYEISISSRGQMIIGSPFMLTASKNILGTLERKSFCLEDGEEIGIASSEGDKKVILRIVDFVTEKMLLNDSGPIEKITTNDIKDSSNFTDNKNYDETKEPNARCKSKELTDKNKFKKVANRVKLLNRSCKAFSNNLYKNKHQKVDKKSNQISQSDVPDIVNSTFADTYNKYDRTAKLDANVMKNIQKDKEKLANIRHSSLFFSTSDDKDSFSSAINETVISSSNPFLNTADDHNLLTEKVSNLNFSTYDYDKEQELPIQILIDEEDTTPTKVTPSHNPFIDHEIFERPKTPILKIITGEVTDRDDSVYVNFSPEQIKDDILQNNEFINPFYIHPHREDGQDSVTDFIIGAPVSMPPIIKAPTPEPDLESLMITSEQNMYSVEVNMDSVPTSVFSTPMHTRTDSIASSTFHSLASEINSNESANYERNFVRNNETPKRDIWDSAYVSIDETNSSPDSNNNENLYDSISKQKFSPSEEMSLKREDFSKLGPAEIELWESCYELSDAIPSLNEDIRSSKWDLKRPIFTPIIEESDRSMSAGLKDLHEIGKEPSAEEDPVTVAFAELNDVFHEYLTPSEQSSLNTFQDDASTRSTETNYNVVKNDDYVDSASGLVLDVMRQTKMKLEGKISGIQSDAAESISVSQNLQAKQNYKTNNKTPIHFGDDPLTNIVLQKKQFWDEKIRQVEEIKSEQRKKRLSSKHLRHNDSLTRRRGQQLIKSKNVSHDSTDKYKSDSSDENRSPDLEVDITDEMHAEGKLVQNWKKYWDQRLETEKEETQVTCFRAKSPKTRRYQTSSPARLEDIREDKPITDSVPIITTELKQDVPEEVMFKAFEESPKRFFGTSRKQILNKIDAFLGKPSTAEEDTLPGNNGAKQERGIVSSRISMFHSISSVEDLSWQKTKSSSMQNIRIRTNSENRNSFKDEAIATFKEKVQSNLDLTKPSINDLIVNHDKIQDTIKDDTVANDDIEIITTKISNDEILDQQRGLVSSRINLFRNISKVEEVPWHKHKSTSMQNIRINSYSDHRKGLSFQDEITKRVYHNNDKIEDTVLDNSDRNTINKNNLDSVKHDDNKETKTPEESVMVTKSPKALSFFKQNEEDKTMSQTKRQSHNKYHTNKASTLKKSSVSKSEMDIFTKINTVTVEDDLDKYKSYDELPKINVKNFVSLYESVSKPSQDNLKTKLEGSTRALLATPEKIKQSSSSILGAESKEEVSVSMVKLQDRIAMLDEKTKTDDNAPKAPPRRKRGLKTASQESIDTMQSMESLNNDKKEETHHEEVEFPSLSEVEVEIIDKTPDVLNVEPSKKDPDTDYKSRFKMAKQYFQSLEELTEETKPTKPNECEQLLLQSAESLEKERPPRRTKKNIKSLSLPSTELCKIWDQMTENESPSKLVKISEKFNVNDLFNDVMEGKLSRQGSLRGIPHKKAVLETFKSMENVTDSKMSPYEIAVKQLSDFAKENQIKNAQTYLSEYPFLPTTDPSKYHSRLDTKASGLISMKELHERRPRRNSVPELVLNPRFTADL